MLFYNNKNNMNIKLKLKIIATLLVFICPFGVSSRVERVSPVTLPCSMLTV